MSFMSPIVADAPVSRTLRTREVLLLLAAFAILIAVRLPGTWSEGRFLDEEVTVFFAYAWNFDSTDALFRPFAGYWNLAANGSTLLLVEAVRADLISLEKAPYVTMLLGLTAQLLPVLLLLTGTANWLEKRSTRLLACAMIVMIPGGDEIVLNVVHIQFHLALSVGILLALDAPRSRWQQGLAAAILLFAPLCGPGAILFLPLFAARAYFDRDGGRLLQFALLGAAAAIQMFLFYTPSPARGLPTEPLLLAGGLFVRLIVLPVLGPVVAVTTGGLSAEAAVAGNFLILPVLAAAGLASIGALIWWTLQRKDAAPWLCASALLVAVISFGLGAAGNAGDSHRLMLIPLIAPRYNYIPLALLGLTMIVLRNRADGRGSRFAGGLILVNLVMSAIFFRIGLPEYTKGVSWPREVAAWRADRNYQLRAWPETARADLSGRRFSCPKHALPPGNINHPRYCESGWIANFYVSREKESNLPSTGKPE
jgi:hypothetical protein